MTDAGNSPRPATNRDGEIPSGTRPLGLLPAWWADAIAEFRECDLRPYRPPQFDDGVVVPPVVDRLETELRVEIRLMGVGVTYGDSWGVYVDGELVRTVERERTRAGYTRYDLTSSAFEDAVRDAVDGNGGSAASRTSRP